MPVSLVPDRIETRYELHVLFAKEAARHDIVEYRRPEVLNTHPLFIESLARLVERHLETGR